MRDVSKARGKAEIVRQQLLPLLGGKDFVERMKTFVEKREPDFEGR